MSTDAVTQFLTKVANDEALQNQAAAIAQGNEDTAGAAVKLGSQHGFEFTAGEFTEMIDAARKARAGQLSDAELEGVTGGKIIWTFAGGIFLGEAGIRLEG